MTFDFQHHKWCNATLFHLVMKLIRNSCKSKGLCTHSECQGMGNLGCLPHYRWEWDGVSQAAHWEAGGRLSCGSGGCLAVQCSCRDKGQPQGGGMLKVQAKAWAKWSPSGLHCMRNHPGLWLNCPALWVPNSHAHTSRFACLLVRQHFLGVSPLPAS